jgi:hypothetical protein
MCAQEPATRQGLRVAEPAAAPVASKLRESWLLNYKAIIKLSLQLSRDRHDCYWINASCLYVVAMWSPRRGQMTILPAPLLLALAYTTHAFDHRPVNFMNGRRRIGKT